MSQSRSAGVTIPSWLVTDQRIDDGLCEILVQLCIVCHPYIYGETTTAALAKKLCKRTDTMAKLLRQTESTGLFRRVRHSPIPLWVMNADAFQVGTFSPAWRPDEALVAAIDQHRAIRERQREDVRRLCGTAYPLSMHEQHTKELDVCGDQCRFPTFHTGTFIILPCELFTPSFMHRINARNISGPRRFFLRLLAHAKGYRLQEVTIKALARESGVNPKSTGKWIALLKKSGVLDRTFITGRKQEPTYNTIVDPQTSKSKIVRRLRLGSSRMRGVELSIEQNKRLRKGAGAISSELVTSKKHTEPRRGADERGRIVENKTNNEPP